MNVLARTAGNPTALQSTLRRLVHQKSPNVAMQFTTMESDASQNVATPRFRTLLLGVFAGLAVILAMAGVYGVMAYVVGQRTNEIGVRIALGASTDSVLRLVFRQGLKLTCLGLVLGLVGSHAVTRLLTTMLFQTKPNDPSVHFGVVVLLVFVSLIATYVPARRASKIDPLTAIRAE